MRHRTPALLIISLLTPLFLLSSPLTLAKAQGDSGSSQNTGTSNTANIPTKANSNEKYLFVQSVHQAKIEKNKQDPSTYTITLHNVSPFVTCFSERPVRKAAQVPISQLLSLWEMKNADGFKMNPPNADINAVHETEDKAPINFLVELTNPVYNKENQTLTYTAKPLVGNIVSMPDNATLHHVNLFIDDVCVGCWWP